MFSLQSHLLRAACLPSMPLCTVLSLKTKRRASFPGEVRQTEEGMGGKATQPGRAEGVDRVGKLVLEELGLRTGENPPTAFT